VGKHFKELNVREWKRQIKVWDWNILSEYLEFVFFGRCLLCFQFFPVHVIVTTCVSVLADLPLQL